MTRDEYTEYVRATQGAFRRFLLALCCGDMSLADDVAQESYIKAYISSDSIRDLSKFKSWIYRIGYNTYLNHRRGVRMMTDYDTLSNTISESAADQGFEYQALYVAMRELPDKERVAVLLYYMQGYSVREIAVIQDSTEESVRQYLSRGRKKLRKLLTENE